MARGGGSSGSMFFIFLICLCLSLSTGAGAYFYTKEDEDTDKDSSVEEEDFKAKYQEAVAALELERATKRNVVLAKSIVEEAQERLEAARRDFESGEYANDGEKAAARTRVFSAEKDAEAAVSNLYAAETDAERAEVNRKKAEDNAESALNVAIFEGDQLIATATKVAEAKLVTAEGNLAEARTNALKVIADAQGLADAAQVKAAQAQKEIRDNADALLYEATSAADTAKIKRDQAAAERTAQKALESELAGIQDNIDTAKGTLATAQSDLEDAQKGIGDIAEARATETARLLGLATAAALRLKPTMVVGNDIHSSGSGILWQSHDIGGRFHSPGGLVWLGGDGRSRTGGQGEWNRMYKFRCMTDGLPSGFTPNYGPVGFRTYHNPKIQVTDSGTDMCPGGGKLEVWDPVLGTNITGAMKDFTGGSAYNGTDNRFYDPRTGIAPKGCQGAWDRSACGTRSAGRRNVATGNQTFRVSEAATAGGACPHNDGQVQGC